MANKIIKVAGTIMWASLDKVNEMSQKYQFELCNLSPAACKAIETELGLTVSTNEDKPEKGSYIVCKSKQPMLKRWEMADGSDLEGSVGNGTKVTVYLSFYDWEFKKKSGRSPSAQKVVVNELKVYGGSEVEDEEEVL